ncbi:MAG TPA: SPOR domain-containing protein [Burkholderiaceae bacterium]|jgi:hypothetical protein
MLKFLFWTLLLANAGLFAYERGYLAAWLPDGREPERMANQLNAENVKPVPAAIAEAKPAADAAAESTAKSTAANAAESACREIAGFDPAGAKRFDSAVQTLALGSKLTRREVEEVANNIVYIPSQGSKEGAEKKATELRHLGITDFYIIQDAGDLHWGISLGVFKTEESARALLTALSQKGVHSARLGTHSVSSTKVAYQVRDLDSATSAGLDKILLDFPHMEKRACASGTASDPKAALTDKKVFPREATH